MNDKSNVFSLRGQPILLDDLEPNEEVVERLEDLLDLARKGDLKGFAFVSHHAGERFGQSICGEVVHPTSLGLLQILTTEMVVNLMDDDDD